MTAAIVSGIDALFTNFGQNFVIGADGSRILEEFLEQTSLTSFLNKRLKNGKPKFPHSFFHKDISMK